MLVFTSFGSSAVRFLLRRSGEVLPLIVSSPGTLNLLWYSTHFYLPFHLISLLFTWQTHIHRITNQCTWTKVAARKGQICTFSLLVCHYPHTFFSLWSSALVKPIFISINIWMRPDIFLYILLSAPNSLSLYPRCAVMALIILAQLQIHLLKCKWLELK